MRAIGYKTSLPANDPNALVDIELPKPEPTGRDILVEVQAISVNPVDTKVRRGWAWGGRLAACWVGTPRESSWPSGLEVQTFKAGRRGVLCRRARPPRRQRRVPSRRRAHRRPQARNARLGRRPPPCRSPRSPPGRCCSTGSTSASPCQARPPAVLIIGGAGGVGSIAIQLARRLPISRSSPRPRGRRRRQWARDLGAHHVVDHRQAARRRGRSARPWRAGLRVLDHQYGASILPRSWS